MGSTQLSKLNTLPCTEPEPVVHSVGMCLKAARSGEKFESFRTESLQHLNKTPNAGGFVAVLVCEDAAQVHEARVTRLIVHLNDLEKEVHTS